MVKSGYQPPFTLTGEIVTLVADIAEQVGRLSAQPDAGLSLRLRRINRIRTVTGSLAIEGNTLGEAQITALLEGKTVLAPPRELQEARNALAVYEHLSDWHPHREADLRAAHRLLMHGLLDHPGAYHSGGVGVMAGDRVLHMAPPANRVPKLMGQLFDWLARTHEHPLIASAVFHYEFEFIHPFADGNGRMGRLWQTLLLSRWHLAFAWLPVESLVHQQQAAYYDALNASARAADSAPFIRFMLGCIRDAVSKADERMRAQTRVQTRVKERPKTPQQILDLLRDNPQLSLADVADALGRAVSTIERAVARLQADGKLRYQGAKKGGRWVVL